MEEPKFKEYIGVKKVLAMPDMKNGIFGYIVRYSDGYESWSPQEAFENAYVESKLIKSIRGIGPIIYSWALKGKKIILQYIR